MQVLPVRGSEATICNLLRSKELGYVRKVRGEKGREEKREEKVFRKVSSSIVSHGDGGSGGSEFGRGLVIRYLVRETVGAR